MHSILHNNYWQMYYNSLILTQVNDHKLAQRGSTLINTPTSYILVLIVTLMIKKYYK